VVLSWGVAVQAVVALTLVVLVLRRVVLAD
jgi:hypothetical protein